MKKNIWIMNHYATGMFDNKGGRHYWFSKNLKEKGYSPTIFCATTYHSKTTKSIDTNQGNYTTAEDENTKMVYVKTTEYMGNGFSRVKNMASFFLGLFSVTKKYTKATKEKPDVILASSVHPLTCVAGIFIAKWYKVPCIVEIRDLWPETIVAYSHKWTKKHLLIKLLYQGEKWIYKKANAVIFTQPGDYDYIKEQGWSQEISEEKCFYINNGVDLVDFDSNKEKFHIEDDDLENENQFKFVYAGAIRRVNDVGVILDAAKKMTQPEIQFLLWGNGEELSYLEERVKREDIKNVIFKGYISKQYIPFILSKADVNLATYSKTEMNRYGTSRNKNFEYMAAGKPILSTEADPYLFDDSFSISFNYQTEDDIVEAVNRFYAMTQEEREKMGQIAREKSKDFDFKVLTQKLVDIIEGLS